MMVHQDAEAVRRELAKKVRDGMRADGLADQTVADTTRLCEERIAKAFVKARLCPKDMNSNHKRIVAEYAAVVANDLHAA